MHLTNVAIQKHHQDYNRDHGGKWSLKNLRLWMEGVYGLERTIKLFSNIEYIVVHSLRSVQGGMINDKHCFECYGYDIIVDDNLKPWLIEVNASPALSSTTHSDRVMKYTVLNDLLNVMCPNGECPNLRLNQNLADRRQVVGGFELLVDEANTTNESAAAAAREKANVRRSFTQWR